MCPIVVYKRDFYGNLQVIDVNGLNVILEVDRFSTFHIVIGYWKKSILVKIPNNPEFELIIGNSIIEPTKFKGHLLKGMLARLDSTPTEILMVSEFLKISGDYH